MENLNRKAILRMWSGKAGNSSSVGGGSDIDLTGYATSIWVTQNFVSIDFFRELFKAYDSNGNEVLPNDTETVIDNIKAMFGFWTDFYVSALGTGGQSTVGLRLAQLADVNVAGVTNGQVLTYDSTTGKWIASTPQSGTDMATVWANLAASGNQQINASHLSTALTGYATQTWVNNQISDMATKTWVGQNYLSKTDAASTYLSIAFFNRLFKAYNGTTQVDPNNTTTAIDNIKAMFGFWTDFYISALGTGGQQSVGLRLAQLADVNVAGVQNDQVLKYDATSQKWVPGTVSSGTDMATVWANLAAVDNTKQIDVSHLTTALNGYATQQWVGQQGYITSSALTGYATQTWVGQQGYQTQTTADGRYLKLSGGIMTGGIKCAQNKYATSNEYGIDMNNSDIIGCNAIRFGDTSDDYTEAVMFYRTNGNFDSFRAIDGTFYFGANSGSEKGVANIGSAAANLNYVYSNEIHPGNNNNLWLNTSTNMHIIANGPLIIPISNDVALSSYGRYALAIGGDPRNNEAHIGIDNNEIMAKGSASTTATLYLNAEGGTVCINETAGNCGIGTGSPSYKLHVNGTIGTGNLYAAGYVTALSDERKKDVVGEVNLTVEQIAKAPAIRFTWKDRDDKTVFAGSIAQYWQKVLPEVVQSQADGTLSLDYQVAALISSITVARKVVNHESRLQRLEKMFAINENDIED